MGSFGVIREAVYIPAVQAHHARGQRANENTQLLCNELLQDCSISQDGIVSIFDDPMIETYAVKTIKKTQKNINDEILNLVAIQQEIYQDKEDTAAFSNCCQIQHCVKLFDIYEDTDCVHLVMENCEGDTLDTIFNFAS